MKDRFTTRCTWVALAFCIVAIVFAALVGAAIVAKLIAPLDPQPAKERR